MSINRVKNSVDSRLHIWKQKRVAQRAEARAQKCFDILRAGEAFAHQQPRDALRPADFIPRNRSVLKLLCRRDDPLAFHRSAYSRGSFLTRRGRRSRSVPPQSFLTATN